MVTDDERREAARRLRGQAKKLGPNMDAHEFANYTADVIDVNECMTWYEMTLLLADLIEPSIPADPGEAGIACVDAFIREHTEKPVDRDALLALADEIEDNDVTYSVSTQYVLDDYARRIREALGVE